MSEPRAPAGPSDRSKRLWRRILGDYHLSSAEVELMRTALVALDEADRAAEIPVREGLVVADRYGTPKQHPAADVENRARAYFARAVAQLGVKATTETLRRVSRPGPKPRIALVKER